MKILKAFGNGVFAVGGTLCLLALPSVWLWSIAAGEMTGPIVIVMAPLALLILLCAFAMLAAIGDAMERWEG